MLVSILLSLALLQLLQARDITIHVIPHSHMDPMWLFRPEEYAERADLIMDGVLQELLRDKHKTFVWEGVYFLQHFLRRHGSENICDRWGKEIMETIASSCLDMHNTLLLLLHRKQLEIVGGSYTAFDEALTSSYGAINSFVTGRNVLRHFNISTPRIAWFIDSFGHASSTSALLLGFDYSHQVLNRLPFQTKQRIQSHGPLSFDFLASASAASFQFVSSSSNFSHISELHTYVLPHHYSSPLHMRLESDISENDAAVYSSQLLHYCLTLPSSSSSAPEHVMLLLGDDFYFRKTQKTYRSVDKLLAHMTLLSSSLRTAHSLTVRYSTPTIFLTSLSAPVVSGIGNLLPYSDNIANDWTGYYASRPELKLLIMTFQRRLQALESIAIGILASEKDSAANTFDIHAKISDFHEFLALCFHHDTITGTSRSDVIDDFMAKLYTQLHLIDETLQSLLHADGLTIVSGNNYNEAFAAPLSVSTVFITNLNHLISVPSRMTFRYACESSYNIAADCDGNRCQQLVDYDSPHYSCSRDSGDAELLHVAASIRLFYEEMKPHAVESFTVTPQAVVESADNKLMNAEGIENSMLQVISKLTLHRFVSGRMWHSSGAYLMRSALHPSISAAAVLGVAFIVSFPLTFGLMTSVSRPRIKKLRRIKWTSTRRLVFFAFISAVYAFVTYSFSRFYIQHAEVWTHPLLPLRLRFFVRVSRYCVFYVGAILHICFADVLWCVCVDVTKYRSFAVTLLGRLSVSCFLYVLWVIVTVILLFGCPELHTPEIPLVPLNKAIWQHGALMSEVTWQMQTDVLLRLRLIHATNQYEIDLMSRVHPGEELLMRFDLKSGDSSEKWIAATRDLWTESRFDYNYLSPVSANYFPVVSQLQLTSPDTSLSLSFSQPAAVVLLKNRMAQVMLHRSCSYDDEKGLGEAMIDTSRAFISISTAADSSPITGSSVALLLPSVEVDRVAEVTHRLNRAHIGLKRLRSLLPFAYKSLDVISHRLLPSTTGEWFVCVVMKVKSDTIVTEGCNLDCSVCQHWHNSKHFASIMKLIVAKIPL